MLPKGRKNISRLSIFFRKSREKHIRNKFYSKAQCFRADFSNTEFTNVNLKGAILTHCNFKESKFLHVDFLGTNLKKSNFSGSTFTYCTFSNALLKLTNFRMCKFKNCTFINTNLNSSKNLTITNDNYFFKICPAPEIDQELATLLNEFIYNKKIHNYRVLHLRGGKINNITLNLLITRLGIDLLKIGLKNLKGNLPYRIITMNCLYKAIDNAAKA